MGSATRQISEKKPGALTMKFLHQQLQNVTLSLKTCMLAATQSSKRVYSRSKKEEICQEYVHQEKFSHQTTAFLLTLTPMCHSQQKCQPVKALRIVRCNDASKALDDVHGLAAEIRQTHACARTLSLNETD